MRAGRLRVGLAAQSAARRERAQRRAQMARFAGRPTGRSVGTWVTDLAELRQSILLCPTCDPGFRNGHQRYGYFRDNRWRRYTGGCSGQCDACRGDFPGGLQLYIHDSYVGKSYQPA